MEAFHRLGYNLSNNADYETGKWYTNAQRLWDDAVPVDAPRPGDLIFYTQTYDTPEDVTHIGIIKSPQPNPVMLDDHDNRGYGETDYSQPYWQEHFYGFRRPRVLVDQAPVYPLSFWTLEEIARATNCPVANVDLNCQSVIDALTAVGQGSKNSLAAALGTIAVETASTFKPLHEYGTPADWAGYSGGSDYAGRGYVQLTHDYNYRAAGDAIGVDLLNNPDLAMQPDIAAKIFAWYWQSREIQTPANAGDWTECRKRVVGRVANPPGLDRLVAVVNHLLA